MSFRSVILGLSVVTITYILVNIAFLLVLTPEEVKSSEVGNFKDRQNFRIRNNIAGCRCWF